jgi:hypothetical protein
LCRGVDDRSQYTKRASSNHKPSPAEDCMVMYNISNCLRFPSYSGTTYCRSTFQLRLDPHQCRAF